MESEFHFEDSFNIYCCTDNFSLQLTKIFTVSQILLSLMLWVVNIEDVLNSYVLFLR